MFIALLTFFSDLVMFWLLDFYNIHAFIELALFDILLVQKNLDHFKGQNLSEIQADHDLLKIYIFCF